MRRKKNGFLNDLSAILPANHSYYCLTSWSPALLLFWPREATMVTLIINMTILPKGLSKLAVLFQA
jgi:hypothetical protein